MNSVASVATPGQLSVSGSNLYHSAAYSPDAGLFAVKVDRPLTHFAHGNAARSTSRTKLTSSPGAREELSHFQHRPFILEAPAGISAAAR
jgi:hypothetical protein